MAGTCCVDFSGLNGNRQDLDALGESGRTLFATVHYMKEYKPKMVIFENVVNAPWVEKDGKKGFDHYVNEAGYTSRHMKLDAKNFYVAQTRQRGYMICIRKHDAYLALCDQRKDLTQLTDEEVEEELDDFFAPGTGGFDHLLDQWEKAVRYLERNASVGADALLLDADDPRLVGLQEGENEEKSKKPTPWEKCADGHLKYRSEQGLGNKHPLTNWSDNTSSLPDYFKRPAKGFTQRVVDTLDIVHARNITRGIDDRYHS